jgi:hypothetical protein
MLALLSLGVAASAHEALEDPIPRYPSDGSSDIKSCPCGVGPNDGLCSGPERSDPNRTTDRVNVYASGETITVRLHEVIGHSGRWRIAFDPDGADQADFDANVLLDVPDPPGSNGNVGQGDLWEFAVTLPDVGCDACTLQVIQVMNGDMANPVPDPIGESSYYQCADLELTGGPVVTTDPDPDPTPDTGTAPYSLPKGATDAAGEDGEAGGCGCDASPAPSGAILSLGLVVTRRRRRT